MGPVDEVNEDIQISKSKVYKIGTARLEIGIGYVYLYLDDYSKKTFKNLSEASDFISSLRALVNEARQSEF